jgi:hydroxymethylpyrimidine kinase / phosphomethylpyrimidine kinase / thiamine-phosphate diphosphorylase
MSNPVVLTIGGSDPSCGAGIQADIRALQLLNIHPVSVITTITIQNTKTLNQIIPLSENIIEQQIENITNDIKPIFVKTGLLYSKEIIEIISIKQEKYHWNLIVDPILRSSTGASCITDDFITALKTILIPRAYMITPNIPEAEHILEVDIQHINDMKQAAKKLYQLGCKHVLIKGGHLSQQDFAVDVFYNGKQFYEFSLPKIHSSEVHGTGCVLSSLITGYLCKDEKPEIAVQKAKHDLWQMINHAYQPGKGMKVCNLQCPVFKSTPPLFESPAYLDTWIEYEAVLSLLIKELPSSFIAEVGCNMGYAIPNAQTFNDICAFSHRLTKNIPRKEHPALTFGGSKHVASIILAAMKYYPHIRCAINIKNNEKILNSCKKATDSIASFNRSDEPEHIKSTMEWGTEKVLKLSKTCPHIIYDTGGVGKEPMIRIIGPNPKKILDMLLSIKRYYKNENTS